MPGRKRWDNDARPPRLLFEPSSANIEFLRSQFPGAEWTDTTDVLAQIDALYEQSRAPATARVASPDDYRFKTKPFDHQLRIFMESRDRKEYALFCEAGTGKTKMLIDTAGWLWAQGKIDGMLIISPNGVHRQWVEEQMPIHMPDFVGCLAPHAWKVGRISDEMFGPTHLLRTLSMNFESLVSEAGRLVAERFLGSGRMMMIIDESHRIKNPSAKITKVCIQLSRKALYRRIATGTPVAKGLEDKFSQMLFLSPFILGFNSFYSFRNNYCVLGGYENRQIIGYRNIEQFQARVAPHAARVRKRDCLDLPPKIGGIDHPDGPLKRYVELTPEQKRHYDRLKTELMTELSDGSIVETALAIQKLIRLQQVIQGHLPREDGTLELIPSNRVKVCQELVEEASGKVVIWTRFRHDVEMLRAAFGDRAVVIQGGQAKENAQSVALFTDKDSGKDVLIANQAAGGTGLNLTVADITADMIGSNYVTDVIYYANSFASIDRWQSEERTYRIGTVFPVTYTDIVARGTMDTAILANLRRKKNISALALGELEVMIQGTEK